MANRVVFKIVTQGGKDVVQLIDDTKTLKKRVDSVSDSYGRGSKAASNFNKSQEKGVIGTAKNSRDFSKLSQTIGSGDNGLVGAYATLAANTFAVVAAFEALKRATNALKVMEGLSAQGARIGKTLSIAADEIRSVTNETLSMADAMRTTAQLTAGGFNADQASQLAQVAKDAAGALGRDTADAVDRLTRGVTKLEPELLDEIGIMIKLDEASRNYATSVNKSAQSLTAAEKRQAYFNAVIEEGERKFGGIGDKVEEYDAYTRLAAAGTDLFNTSIGTLASALAPVAELFADNKIFLVGAIALYAASIKDDLIPALAKAAIKQKELVSAANENQLAKSAQLGKQLQAMEDSYTKDENGTRGASGRFQGPQIDLASEALTTIVSKYEDGSIAAEDFSRSQQRLDEALGDVNTRLETAVKGSARYADLMMNRDDIIENKNAVLGLNQAYLEQEVAVSKLNTLQIAQQTTIGNLIPSIKAMGSELKNQNTNIKALDTLQLQAYSGVEKRYKGAAATVSRWSGVAGTAVRGFGTIALNFLPLIGQISFAIGILTVAFKTLKNAITTDAEKEYVETLEDFNTIISEASNKAREFARITEDSVTSFKSQIDALKLTGNAVDEITSKFFELRKAQEAAADSSRLEKFQNFVFGNSESQGNSTIDNAIRDATFMNQTKSLQGLKALQALYGSVNDETKKYIVSQIKAAEAAGDYDKRLSMQADAIEEVQERTKGLTLAVTNVEETFRNLETATTEFIQSATISTPFDALRENLSKTNTAVEEFTQLAIRGSITAEEIGKSLSSIGNQSRNLLGDALPQLLYLEGIQSQMKEIDALGDDATAAQAIQYSQLQRQSKILSAEIGPKIQDSLAAREKEVRALQQNSRLLKNQLTIEDARFKKISDIVNVGAEGYRAREAHEEKKRALTARQLQLQANLLEITKAQTQLTIDELKNKLLQLEIERDITKEVVNRFSISQESMSTLLGNMQLSYGAGSEESAEVAKRIASITTAISSAEKGMQDLDDSIAALRTESAGILAQNLSEAEKFANAMGEEFKVTAEFSQKLLEYSIGIVSVNRDIETYNRRINGVVSDLESKYREIQETYDSNRRSLIQQLAISSEQLGVDLEKVKAQRSSNRLTIDEVKSAQKAYDVSEARYDAEKAIVETKLRQEEVTARLKQLELTLFDARRDGLEWQEKSISYIERESQLVGEMVSKTNDLRKARQERSRIASGLGETNRSQNNDAVREAAYALKEAKARAEIRFSAINAEYALLEAQKILLQEELSSRRELLRASGVSQDYLTPLNAAISTLRSVDVSSLKEMAKNGVRMDISLAEANLETTLEKIGSRVLQDGPLKSFLERQRDNKGETTAIAEAAEAFSAPVKEGIEILAGTNKTGLEELTKEQQKALVPIVSPIQALANDVSVIKNHLIKGGTQGSNIVAVGQQAEAEGLRVSGHSAFGGKELGRHSKNSKHYSDNALDINFDYGNTEAQISYMKKKFDQLALDYQSKGMTVLWNGKKYHPEGGTSPLRGNPHYDHLHVEVPAGVTASRATPTHNHQGAGQIEERTAALESSLPSNMSVKSTGLASNPTDLKANFEGMPSVVQDAKKALQDFSSATNPWEKLSTGLVSFREDFNYVAEDLVKFAEKMGPEGELILAISSGVNSVTGSVSEMSKTFANSESSGTERFLAVAQTASAVMSTIGQITAAASQNKIRLIDAEISAEQRRDGKSLESQRKIEALEKKKTQVQKKQFSTNKKLMMAEAVIATATGIAKALSMGPIIGPIMAAVIGAMGAAQLAIIAGTTFQGGSTSDISSSIKPTSISVGKLGNSINLDRSNANAGGEVGYLRGTQGYGSNGSNYSTVGSAYGGLTSRGYGHRSFLVGEKGPEEISTSEPMMVKPTTENTKEGDSIYISAIDSQSIEDMFDRNSGMMIEKIRKRANSSGKTFMEDVDTKGGTKR